MATVDDWKFDLRKIKAKERGQFLDDVRKSDEPRGEIAMIKWVRRTLDCAWPEGNDWSTDVLFDQADTVDYQVCLRAFVRDFRASMS